MKSQEQLIGYLLLGIVVLSISVAIYNYVTPTIQKFNVRNVAISLEENVKKLSEAISLAGFRYSRSSFEFEAPNAQMEILPDQIKIKLKAPVGYYSSYIKVPINYYEPPICYNNSFPVVVENNYTLCFEDSKLYVYIIDNQNMMIRDSIFNKTIILPLDNHKNIITSLFVFDIFYNGTQISFIPLYPTGIYRISPACIANAYQTSEDIYYEVVCRPLIDLATKNCYWIRISPYYQSFTNIRDKVTISINYNYYEDVRFNSTVCDSVRIIDLYVSIV